MSIYSGFATRVQEENYDQLVEDLIFVMQKRILKFYKQEQTDQDKFLDVLKHLHGQLSKMEEHKYLQPKTSRSFEDMIRYLQGQNKNGHHQDLNDAFFTPNKDSHTAPLRVEKRLRSHRDSFSHMNEPASVGRIVHQIPRKNGDESNPSLADSRNTFFHPEMRNRNTGTGANPEQRSRQEDEKSIPSQDLNNPNNLNNLKGKNNKQLKGIRFHQSNDKLPDRQKDQSKDFLMQYLQKNNKNYIRGYRKRQVKTRQFSKEYTNRV